MSGMLYADSIIGTPFLPRLQARDILGIIISGAHHHVVFTLNGNALPPVPIPVLESVAASSKTNYVPALSFLTAGAKIRTNFGEDVFRYNLDWDIISGESNVHFQLFRLYNNPLFFPDVCFRFNGTPLTLFGHKAFLAARSLTFEILFSGEISSHEMVHDPEYDMDCFYLTSKPDVFCKMLRFIYGGSITISSRSEAADLLDIASEYALETLMERCFAYTRMVPAPLPTDHYYAPIEEIIWDMLDEQNKGAPCYGCWMALHQFFEKECISGPTDLSKYTADIFSGVTKGFLKGEKLVALANCLMNPDDLDSYKVLPKQVTVQESYALLQNALYQCSQMHLACDVNLAVLIIGNDKADDISSSCHRFLMALKSSYLSTHIFRKYLKKFPNVTTEQADKKEGEENKQEEKEEEEEKREEEEGDDILSDAERIEVERYARDHSCFMGMPSGPSAGKSQQTNPSKQAEPAPAPAPAPAPVPQPAPKKPELKLRDMVPISTPDVDAALTALIDELRQSPISSVPQSVTFVPNMNQLTQDLNFDKFTSAYALFKSNYDVNAAAESIFTGVNVSIPEIPSKMSELREAIAGLRKKWISENAASVFNSEEESTPAVFTALSVPTQSSKEEPSSESKKPAALKNMPSLKKTEEGVEGVFDVLENAKSLDSAVVCQKCGVLVPKSHVLLSVSCPHAICKCCWIGELEMLFCHLHNWTPESTKPLYVNKAFMSVVPVRCVAHGCPSKIPIVSVIGALEEELGPQAIDDFCFGDPHFLAVCTKYRMSMAHARAVSSPLNLSVKIKRTSSASALGRYVTWIYTSSLHDTIENREGDGAKDAHTLIERDILKLAVVFKDQMFVTQYLYARLKDIEDTCRKALTYSVSGNISLATKTLRDFVDTANWAAECSCFNVVNTCCKVMFSNFKFLSMGYSTLDKARPEVLRALFANVNTCTGSQGFFLSDDSFYTETLFFMRCVLCIGKYDDSMHVVFDTIVNAIKAEPADKREVVRGCLALLLVASPDFKGVFSSQVRPLTTAAIKKLYMYACVLDESGFKPFEGFDPKDIDRVKNAIRSIITIPGDGLLTWSSVKCSTPGSDGWEQGKCVICDKEFRGFSRPRLCTCCQRNTCKNKCSVKISPTAEGKARSVQSQHVCVSCANVSLLAYDDLLTK